jgi:drug/metabolite transporter (DMT)-like permease
VRFEGEAAAIGAALLWAFGGLLFATAGRRIGSATVNEIRLSIASVLLLVLHLGVAGTAFPEVSDRGMVLLVASGIVGLTLGDLCFFHCSVAIGPRLAALLMATSPAMAGVLGWLFIGEVLGPAALAGMAVTMTGVVAVIQERRGRDEWRADLSPEQRRLAIVTGLLGALGQAGGGVLSKLGMYEGSIQAVDAFGATVIRVGAAAVAALVLGVVAGRGRALVAGLRDRQAMRLVLVAVVLGPTVGVWLSQVAFAKADVAVAQTLLSLVPVIMLPIARVAYGARPGPMAILGTLVAVGGTALLLGQAG